MSFDTKIKEIYVEYRIGDVWNLEEICEEYEFNKEDIEDYEVKFNHLYIELKNGNEIEIMGNMIDFDFKHHYQLEEIK